MVAPLSSLSVSGLLATSGVSPLSQASGAAAPPAPAAQTTFSASYAPEIYAVYLNGLVATSGDAAPALETNVWQATIASGRLVGDSPFTAIPGAPPVVPWPAAEGTQGVILSLAPLAGSGRIFSSSTPVASGQTAAVSTGAPQSSGASHSTSHVATK